jgi:adenine-specific DNA-methyltransferase
LLKDGGYLGFIVSNKFMVSDFGEKIRKFILEKCKIVRVIDLADAKRVFPDALVSTVIIILQKTPPKPKYNVKRFIADKDTTTFKESLFEDVDITDFVANDGTFNVRYSSDKDSIYKKINQLEKFGKVFDVRTGIMGFEYWKMEPFIHDGKQDDKDIRIATNSYLDRYTFLWNKKINLYKKNFTNPYANIEKLPISGQTKQLFLTKNKIIVRGVAKRLTAMIDNEGTGFLVAVHQIQTDKKHDPKLILGILNSNFFNWIHKDRFYLGRIPEGSLKYPVKFLKRLPMPPEGNDIPKAKVVINVEKMLSVKRQIIKLGDKKTDELTKLEDELTRVNKEINGLVYNIYGINEKERAIIEADL